MKKSKAERVRDLIEKTNGKFFTVKFVKKNGDIRIMTARLGVKKYLKGGKRTVPEDAIVVFTPEKESYHYDAKLGKEIPGSYKSFYPDSVLEIHFNKKIYKFKK